LKCSVCPRIFSDQRALCIHSEEAHAEKKTHECRVCHQNFISASELQSHLQTHVEASVLQLAQIIKNSFLLTLK
jgi:hypothetical protein